MTRYDVYFYTFSANGSFVPKFLLSAQLDSIESELTLSLSAFTHDDDYDDDGEGEEEEK